MFRHQRRAKALVRLTTVVLPNQSQRLLTPLIVNAVRRPADVAMNQRLGAAGAVVPQQSFGLPIAHLQQLRRFAQLQIPSL